MKEDKNKIDFSIVLSQSQKLEASVSRIKNNAKKSVQDFEKIKFEFTTEIIDQLSEIKSEVAIIENIVKSVDKNRSEFFLLISYIKPRLKSLESEIILIEEMLNSINIDKSINQVIQVITDIEYRLNYKTPI